MHKISLALTAVLAVASTLMASTIPYPNKGALTPAHSFVATASGDVVAYFYSSHAGNEEQVGLFVDGQQLGAWGLDDWKSTFGQAIDFGYVTAGAVLQFQLKNISTKTTLYSDPAANADQRNHVYETAFGGQTWSGVTIPKGLYIGFEDTLAPKSDFNYGDDQFIVGNTTAIPLIPEPEAGSSMALGLLCIAIGCFRRRPSSARL